MLITIDTRNNGKLAQWNYRFKKHKLSFKNKIIVNNVYDDKLLVTYILRGIVNSIKKYSAFIHIFLANKSLKMLFYCVLMCIFNYKNKNMLNYADLSHGETRHLGVKQRSFQCCIVWVSKEDV